MTITAIVPAHNEAATVAQTVAALLDLVTDVVVVDDGSTDDTSSRARDAGARVVRLARNEGKGAALAAGLKATEAGVILIADADLGSSAKNLGVLLAEVLQDRADLAVAAPPPSGRSGFGFVEGLSRVGIRRLTGREMARPLSGQRAARRAVFLQTGFARGFGVETAMTIDAVCNGFRVVEVPCEFTHNRTGRDLRGFLHRAKQGADVARVLFRRWLTRGRERGKVSP